MGDGNISHKNFAVRLMFNRWFIFLYITVCIITVYLFGWEIKTHGWGEEENESLPTWYILLDWGVIVLLTFRFTLRIISTKSAEGIFGSLLEIFDFFVLFVCVSSQILWFSLYNEIRSHSTASIVVLCVRHGSRFLLMAFVCVHWHQHRMKIASLKQRISFSEPVPDTLGITGRRSTRHYNEISLKRLRDSAASQSVQ